MAESVVSSVVQRLGDLLIREAKFLRGVSRQIELMQIELELMQSYLEDADKSQDEDKRVQTWVSRIKEAAYDAEDVIETFVIKIASRRRGGIQNAFKRSACIIDEATELHEVGSEIEAIKTKISTLTRCLETYGIRHKREGEGSSSDNRRQRHWRQSYSHVVEEYTVGLDGDVKKLVAQLVNVENVHCRVVSICGMGGLGKTTLAKKLYHHSDIRHRFDGFAWAYISQECQPRDVWEGILFQLISPSPEHRDEIKRLRNEEVADKLYRVQLEKKCLVILDDIWTTTAWDSLRPAFPVAEASSKMLLTSRNKEVPLHVDPSGFRHEPQILTEEEGWKLLQKKAFPGKDDSGASMEELGKKMVGRCAGLPLAIVVLGGLLATKHTPNEWEKVHENINLYLRRGKGHEQQESRVYEVLALSYHELPYQLKPCFLHLGHFPEDFDIPTKKLVRMWVAEGIVLPMQCDIEGEETLEDVAERYLGELIDRCMVQVGVRGSTGRVRTCRLHDLMRDLCLSMANQENFLKIVHNQDGNEPIVSLSSTVASTKSSRRVRRLAIHLSKMHCRNFSWEHERTPYLRSLLFFHTYNFVFLEKKKFRFSDFKLLRILDAEKCWIKGRLPRAIGNLIHLRYLSLNCDGITNIPSSIGNLRYLQTLRFGKAFELMVPNVIWKMEQLRHLYLPFVHRKKRGSGKLRLGNLSDLQTLQGFNASFFDVKELINLTNLKKLQIHHLKNFKELEGILLSPRVTLNRLYSLSITIRSDYAFIIEETDLQGLLSGCQHLYKLHLRGRIQKLPEYSQFPPNLTKLTLSWSRLEKDPMATLEKLPNLSILRLRRSFIGKEMVCSSKGFPQLKSLALEALPNLEEWRVGEEAMPNLCELKIYNCEKGRWFRMD